MYTASDLYVGMRISSTYNSAMTAKIIEISNKIWLHWSDDNKYSYTVSEVLSYINSGAANDWHVISDIILSETPIVDISQLFEEKLKQI